MLTSFCYSISTLHFSSRRLLISSLLLWNQSCLTHFFGPRTVLADSITICLKWVQLSFGSPEGGPENAVCNQAVNKVSTSWLGVPIWWCWMWLKWVQVSCGAQGKCGGQRRPHQPVTSPTLHSSHDSSAHDITDVPSAVDDIINQMLLLWPS